MNQQILAVSTDEGGIPETYLLSAADKLDPITKKPVKQAQVLDLTQQRLFPPFNLDSLAARGYWEPFTEDQSLLPSLLAQVKQP
jgi:hypothetical protein